MIIKHIFILMVFFLWMGILRSQPSGFIAELSTSKHNVFVKKFVSDYDGFILMQQMHQHGFSLTKFDECLNVIWCKIKPISSISHTHDIAGSADEDYFFMVNKDRNTSDGSIITVSKLEKIGGAVVWSKNIAFPGLQGHPNFIGITEITATADSGIVIVSSHGLSNNVYKVVSIHKIAKDGGMVFTKTLDELQFSLNSINLEVHEVDGTIALLMNDAASHVIDRNLYILHISENGDPVIFYKVTSIGDKWMFRGSAKLTEQTLLVLGVGRQDKRIFYFTIENLGSISGIKAYITNQGTGNFPFTPIITTKDSSVIFWQAIDTFSRQVINYNIGSNAFRSKRYPTSYWPDQEVFEWNNSVLFFGTFTKGAILGGRSLLGRISDFDQDLCADDNEPRDTTGNNVPFDSIPQYLPLPADTSLFFLRDTTVILEDASQEVDIICSDIKIPKVELGNDTLICAGSLFQLNAGNPLDSFSYTWSTGDTVAEITATTSGRYWVEVSNGGCTATDTIDLVFLDDAQSILPDDTTLCPYDSLLVSIPASGNYRFITPTNDTLTHGAIYAKDSGTYYLYAELDGDCVFRDSIQLILHDLPAAKAGPDTLLCYNQEYVMQGAGGVSYHWIPATYLSNDTIPDPVAQLPHQQNYILIVGNNAGCRDTSAVSLDVRSPLNLSLRPSDTIVCKGDMLQFIASATGGDSSSYSFTWNGNSSTGASHSQAFYSEGWLYVTLEDGCSPEVGDSIFVQVADPQADFMVQPDDTAHINNSLHLINYSENAAHYSWDFVNGESSTLLSPTVAYGDTGRFQIRLVAFTEEGCADTAMQWVWVLPELKVFIPNAFHPGGGINDVFAPTTSAEVSWHLEVYNRWGQKVWEGTNTGWDGQYKGAPAPEGVYVYKIQLLDTDRRENAFRGNVHLLR